MRHRWIKAVNLVSERLRNAKNVIRKFYRWRFRQKMIMMKIQERIEEKEKQRLLALWKIEEEKRKEAQRLIDLKKAEEMAERRR